MAIFKNPFGSHAVDVNKSQPTAAPDPEPPPEPEPEPQPQPEPQQQESTPDVAMQQPEPAPSPVDVPPVQHQPEAAPIQQYEEDRNGDGIVDAQERLANAAEDDDVDDAGAEPTGILEEAASANPDVAGNNIGILDAHADPEPDDGTADGMIAPYVAPEPAPVPMDAIDVDYSEVAPSVGRRDLSQPAGGYVVNAGRIYQPPVKGRVVPPRPRGTGRTASLFTALRRRGRR